MSIPMPLSRLQDFVVVCDQESGSQVPSSVALSTYLLFNRARYTLRKQAQLRFAPDESLLAYPGATVVYTLPLGYVKFVRPAPCDVPFDVWLRNVQTYMQEYVQTQSDNLACMVNVGGAALFNMFCLAPELVEPFAAVDDKAHAWWACAQATRLGDGRSWYRLTQDGLTQETVDDGYLGSLYGVPIFLDQHFDAREGVYKYGAGLYGVGVAT